VSTFFAGFGGGVVFPILPNLGNILGISPFVVGLILSANRFTRIVANAPAGSLVDRFGTRKPLIVGLIIEGGATLGYVVGLKSSVPEMWFLLARVFWGLGSALVFATAYTIAVDVSDQQSRGTNMGVVRGGITFGFPAGLVLGGIISDLHSITAAFVLAAVFALLASGIAYLLVPETHVSTHQVTVKPWEINRSLPALTIGLVNFGLFFAYLGVLFSTLVLFIDSRGISILNYNPQSMSGLLMAITVLIASGSMIGGGKISDIFRSRILVLLSFLLVSFVGFVLLVLTESTLTLAITCVFIALDKVG
jgi:MFS family permease